MKNKTLVKNAAKTFFAAVALMLFSSCNRGYGCPTNFSVDFWDVLNSAVQILF